jgi:hypothetical protein
VPYILPFALASPISHLSRFQGEADADANRTYGYYDCAFPALITDWRKQFGRLDTVNGIPPAFFAGVMLSAYINDSNVSGLQVQPVQTVF